MLILRAREKRPNSIYSSNYIFYLYNRLLKTFSLWSKAKHVQEEWPLCCQDPHRIFYLGIGINNELECSNRKAKCVICSGGQEPRNVRAFQALPQASGNMKMDLMSSSISYISCLVCQSTSEFSAMESFGLPIHFCRKLADERAAWSQTMRQRYSKPVSVCI